MGFDRTREAVRVYDADKPRRNALWEAATTNEGVLAAQAEDRAAEDKVRESFALDTADVNTRSQAFLVHPDDPWLRKLLERV